VTYNVPPAPPPPKVTYEYAILSEVAGTDTLNGDMNRMAGKGWVLDTFSTHMGSHYARYTAVMKREVIAA
jgi:hypothetical protein